MGAAMGGPGGVYVEGSWRQSGLAAGMDVAGLTQYDAMVWAMQFEAAVITNSWTPLNHAAFFISMFLYYLFLIIYQNFSSIAPQFYGVAFQTFADPGSWWVSILILGFMAIIDLSTAYIRRMWLPSATDIAVELDLGYGEPGADGVVKWGDEDTGVGGGGAAAAAPAASGGSSQGAAAAGSRVKPADFALYKAHGHGSHGVQHATASDAVLGGLSTPAVAALGVTHAAGRSSYVDSAPRRPEALRSGGAASAAALSPGQPPHDMPPAYRAPKAAYRAAGPALTAYAEATYMGGGAGGAGGARPPPSSSTSSS
jgi:hypothetical protein